MNNPKPVDRRDFLKSAAMIGASVALGQSAAPARAQSAAQSSTESLATFSLQPMDKVRLGFVGTGNRGTSLINDFMHCDAVEIKALCDIRPDRAQNAQSHVVNNKRPTPDLYTDGNEAYKKLCDRDDIDLVINATPWNWHVPIGHYALTAGKSAAIEVPMALNVDDCWKLIETAAKVGRHCTMLENCCYGESEMMVLNMVRQGVFGEVLHGEGAYLHNLKDVKFSGVHEGEWRLAFSEKFNGNLYPTHGLGPIAQYMNINRGDRFDYLVSMSSPARGLQVYAEEHFGKNDPRAKTTYACGDMNTSLIKTMNGKTIMLQHDTTTTRPYSRINMIAGTKGVFAGYPDRITFSHEWATDAEFTKLREKYMHPLWKKLGAKAQGSGHGGMDFVMAYRLIDCLHRGLPLDQSVYDGAAWSCIVELSINSVANRSKSVDFPDFTRGAWKTTDPLGIVS